MAIWRIYIDNGHTTVIFTDHESLKYLATMRKRSKRLARWIEEFGEYNVDLRYRKGSEQVVPDALSRRPDLMGEGPRNVAAQLASIRGVPEDDWASHFVAYLDEQTVPPSEALHTDFDKQKDLFTTRNGRLHRIENEAESPYIEEALRADFMDSLHSNYGHLGFPGIQGIVTGRGCWHSLVADLRKFISYCPQCQIAQRSQPQLERERPQTLNSNNLQIFDRWAIDLIGILPQTHAGNRWIVTAIEYLTGWPIAKALPDAKAERIAAFIHEEIAMVYGPPKELLSDNGSNLTGKVMQAYTDALKTKHRVTTPYHPRTNGKVENFNGFLGSTLTKLMVNQSTTLWDQYLPQALFAVRVRVHATTRHSPYQLLFGRNPRLPSDNNDFRPLELTENDWHLLLERIRSMQHARLVANRRLVARAIEAQKIPKQPVRPTSFIEGDWVLVRAEARNKFEDRWFGPYRVVKAFPLGKYRLSDPKGNIVTTLLNGQRLISARVNDQTRTTLWNSSQVQGALRRRGITLDESSAEVAALFDKESRDTMSYDELASIPESEWKKWERTRFALPTQVDRNEIAKVNEALTESISMPQSHPQQAVAEHRPAEPTAEGHNQSPEIQETPPPADMRDSVDMSDTRGVANNWEPTPMDTSDNENTQMTDSTVLPDSREISPLNLETDASELAYTDTLRHTRTPNWLRESQAGFGERQRDEVS